MKNKRLSESELEAIHKRAEAATCGPWELAIDEEFDINLRNDSGVGYIGTLTHVDEADADFIANARKDVPALLAEIERLSAAVEMYRNLEHSVKRTQLNMRRFSGNER